MDCLHPHCWADADDNAPVSLCAAHLLLVFAFVLPLAEEKAGEQLIRRHEVPPPGRLGVLRDAEGWVYFVRIGSLIKIGWSSSPETRFKALKPDAVLHLMPGRLADEKKCHAAFAHLREKGEHFRPAPDLLAFIADIGGDIPADWYDLPDTWTGAA